MLPCEGASVADAARRPACCLELVRSDGFVGFRAPFVHGRLLQVSRRTRNLILVSDTFGVHEQLTVLACAPHPSGLLLLTLQPRQLPACSVDVLLGELLGDAADCTRAMALRLGNAASDRSPGHAQDGAEHASEVLDLSLRLTRAFARRMAVLRLHAATRAWLTVARVARTRTLAADELGRRAVLAHALTKWRLHGQLARERHARVYVAAAAVRRWAYRRQLHAFAGWRQAAQLLAVQRRLLMRAVTRLVFRQLSLCLLAWCVGRGVWGGLQRSPSLQQISHACAPLQARRGEVEEAAERDQRSHRDAKSCLCHAVHARHVA